MAAEFVIGQIGEFCDAVFGAALLDVVVEFDSLNENDIF